MSIFFHLILFCLSNYLDRISETSDKIHHEIQHGSISLIALILEIRSDMNKKKSDDTLRKHWCKCHFGLVESLAT